MTVEIPKVDPQLAVRYFSDKIAFTTGPVELVKMREQDVTLQVIDVRAASDYRKNHIPNSINLPEEEWDTQNLLLKDRLHVLVCYSQVCHLAARAAQKFAQQGYRVMELEGGFKAWTEHKMPLEQGSGEPLDLASAI